MTAFVRVAVVGFALSNLYLLALTGPLVSPQHELIFHMPGSPTPLFVAVILDVLLVWALLSLALWWVRRSPRMELVLWSALLLVLPSGLLATAYGFQDIAVPFWPGWLIAGAALATFVSVNLRWRSVVSWLPKVQHATALVLSFLSLAQLLLLIQMLWFGWQTRHLNRPFIPTSAQGTRALASSRHPARVVWIILDELSYDQVFGQRYPGLALPCFDRLAAESVVFTRALPAAEYTRIAVPSLLTGEPLRRTQPGADGQTLTMFEAETGRKTTFTGADTVFGDARRAGLQTAVAGWYEPYCRLLNGTLNRCFWTYSDELPGGLTTGGGLLRHMAEPFLHLVRLVSHPAEASAAGRTAQALDVDRHRDDYEALLSASDELLRSKQPGLVLIHMPIPHPWGFYDRRSGTFPQHRTSYLDNLALADAYLGRVRAELEAQGLWDDTALVIMGDHSWRTSTVWKSSAHWTREEQAASHGGGFDERPGVIVKLKNQHTAATVNQPFDTVRTRAMIDALMTNRLLTAEELQRWVATGGLPPVQVAVPTPSQP